MSGAEATSPLSHHVTSLSAFRLRCVRRHRSCLRAWWLASHQTLILVARRVLWYPFDHLNPESQLNLAQPLSDQRNGDILQPIERAKHDYRGTWATPADKLVDGGVEINEIYFSVSRNKQHRARLHDACGSSLACDSVAHHFLAHQDLDFASTYKREFGSPTRTARATWIPRPDEIHGAWPKFLTYRSVLLQTRASRKHRICLDRR